MLFTQPSKAFALAVEQWHGKQPVILFATYGVLMGMNGFNLSSAPGFRYAGLLFVAIMGLALGWFGLIVMAGLTQYADRRFDTTVSLDHLTTAFALAAVPAILFHGLVFISNLLA